MRSVHWAVNDSPAEVTNLPTDLLWGEEAIEEELLGLRYRVRPGAFLQTNTEMCEVLYELAREYAALTGEETVYDLYCGIGTIGLTLARDALTVWGIEYSEESVACAVENAELNGLANAAFFAGDVARDLDELPAAPARPTSSSSTRRAPASPARRSGGSGSCRRRGSSTSPATRRRWPGTRRSSSATTATASTASARWTCSPTRRTSRRVASFTLADEPPK